MFCKNCGVELEDKMAFCPECGTKVETEVADAEVTEPVLEETSFEESAEVVLEETEATAETSEEEVVAEDADAVAEEVETEFSVDGTERLPEDETSETQDEFVESSVPAKKSNKLLVSIIAGVLMIVLVLAGVFVVPGLFGGNYEDVAINYGLAYAEVDLVEVSKYTVNDIVSAYKKMVDYSCEEYEMTKEEFYETLSEQYGETITDVEQLFVIMKEEGVTYLQEEYGNYTLSAAVKKAEVMTAEEITTLKANIKEEQSYDYPSMFDDVDTDKITEGYNVELEVTITGTEDSDTEVQNVIVVKYNGKWKAVID